MDVLPRTRAGRIRLLLLLLTPVALAASLGLYGIPMPGESFQGTPPELTPEELATRGRLRRLVQVLAGEIGERHVGRPDALVAAAEFLERELAGLGYEVGRQTYATGSVEVANLEVARTGSAGELGCIVVGAHYDTVPGTPGADDNASGAAALIEIARLLRQHAFRHDVRFVLYANEEPPYFQTDAMGSLVHARGLAREGVDVVAMISLESIGYCTTAAASQDYPPLFGAFYPDRGVFLAFAGNLGSRSLVRRAVRAFRGHATLPSEGIAAPGFIVGVGWSDHWAYWEQGYPAVMVTDTAPFRNPGYHGPADTPETLDYEAMTRAVRGLVRVIQELDG